jgi:uncharacterized protein YcaQ
MPNTLKSRLLSQIEARRIWLRAQRLDGPGLFGSGPAATLSAVEHLGYLQIDTINVIERCHHHILRSRIPDYRRDHLRQVQAVDKSVFEYWTHALSYIPTKDLRFFLRSMKRHRDTPRPWFDSVKKNDLRKVIALIRSEGALSIRDIDDEVLVEKDHVWASRKPSKRALQLAFFRGDLTVSERFGMLKRYDLIDRHFGWKRRPRPASEEQIIAYQLDRALRSQGLVSLDSICHLAAKDKKATRQLIEERVSCGRLIPVAIKGNAGLDHWSEPNVLDRAPLPSDEMIHILSPFDPLIIQRKRLKLFFDYDHRFEAYLPKEKRMLGYFALPVLIGPQIVAAIDLKADRLKEKLLIKQWTWIGRGSSPSRKVMIEEELHRFANFQFDR